MEIGERLRLSEAPEKMCAFRDGMFVRFYDAHMAWFCRHAMAPKVLSREGKER